MTEQGDDDSGNGELQLNGTAVRHGTARALHKLQAALQAVVYVTCKGAADRITNER